MKPSALLQRDFAGVERHEPRPCYTRRPAATIHLLRRCSGRQAARGNRRRPRSYRAGRQCAGRLCRSATALLLSTGTGETACLPRRSCTILKCRGLRSPSCFANVRDDVLEVTKNEQQPFVYGSLSRRAIYLTRPAVVSRPSEHKPGERYASGRGCTIKGGARAFFSGSNRSSADRDLGDHGEGVIAWMSRWIWRILGDGTYKFRAEATAPGAGA